MGDMCGFCSLLEGGILRGACMLLTSFVLCGLAHVEAQLWHDTFEGQNSEPLRAVSL